MNIDGRISQLVASAPGLWAQGWAGGHEYTDRIIAFALMEGTTQEILPVALDSTGQLYIATDVECRVVHR